MKYIFLLSVIVAFFSLWGCEEIDVPVLVDEEELIRYITDSEDARELFRTSNLITDDPYIIPIDAGAVYTDNVDSVNRTVSVLILVDKREKDFIAFYKAQGKDTFVTYIQDFGSPFGQKKDAEVKVEDKFFLKTTRIKGTDTTEYVNVRTLVRYGYFLKLGDDSRPFSGWILRAYSGGGPVAPEKVEIVRENNSMFRGDSLLYETISSRLIDITTSAWDTIEVVTTQQPYIELSGINEIARISDGESIKVNVVESSALSMFHLISAETDSGFVYKNMLPINSIKYNATIKTPSNNNRLWNLIFLQEFRKSQGDITPIPPFNTLVKKGWMVPYRVQ